MKTIEVQIGDQTYVVRADDMNTHNPERVRQAAQLIDDKMREIAAASRERLPVRMALLAALNIADELLRLRADQERATQTQSAVTQRLIEQIDTELQTLRPDSLD